MKLTKRANFIAGLLIGAILALCIQYMTTHHVVIDQNTCRMTDEGYACDYHYERN